LCSIKRRFLEIPNIRNITNDKAKGIPPRIIKEKTKECGSVVSDCFISDKLTGKKKFSLSSAK
jgi:hypothetical protein